MLGDQIALADYSNQIAVRVNDGHTIKFLFEQQHGNFGYPCFRGNGDNVPGHYVFGLEHRKYSSGYRNLCPSNNREMRILQKLTFSGEPVFSLIGKKCYWFENAYRLRATLGANATAINVIYPIPQDPSVLPRT